MRIFTCITAFFCSLAHADWEDPFAGLWWNPAQSGWGVSVQQQGEHVVATLLVYAKSGEAKWYQARDITLPQWNPYILWDPVAFAGSLREGGSSREVGQILFNIDQAEGKVSYTIDGVENESPIVRAAFARNSLEGGYTGAATIGPMGSCAVIARTGAVRLTASTSGDSVNLTLANDDFSCNAQGTYLDFGPTGAISGRAQCSGIDGMPGDTQFFADDIRIERDMVSLNFQIGGSASGACGMFGPLEVARAGARLSDDEPPHDDVGGLWTTRAGWSITAHQQANNLFALVLAGDGTWYAAPNASYAYGQDGDFTTYSGDLLAVHGSPYTRAYDPSQFKALRAGRTELSADTAGYSAASFDVDGVGHADPVTRLIWPRDIPIRGSYFGIRTNVLPVAPTLTLGTFTIDQASIEVSIGFAASEGIQCNVSGAMQWTGLVGEIHGSGTCSDGRSGAFLANQVRLTDQGIGMRYWFLGEFGAIAAVKQSHPRRNP